MEGKEPQVLTSISCPFQTMTLVQYARWKSISALATQTEGTWKDKCYHRWELGSFARQWAVLPKLLPNPIQSHKRTPSMNTMGTTGVSVMSFCLPVRYHTWIRGKRLRHQGSRVGTRDSQVSLAPFYSNVGVNQTWLKSSSKKFRFYLTHHLNQTLPLCYHGSKWINS